MDWILTWLGIDPAIFSLLPVLNWIEGPADSLHRTLAANSLISVPCNLYLKTLADTEMTSSGEIIGVLCTDKATVSISYARTFPDQRSLGRDQLDKCFLAVLKYWELFVDRPAKERLQSLGAVWKDGFTMWIHYFFLLRARRKKHHIKYSHVENIVTVRMTFIIDASIKDLTLSNNCTNVTKSWNTYNMKGIYV